MNSRFCQETIPRTIRSQSCGRAKVRAAFGRPRCPHCEVQDARAFGTELDPEREAPGQRDTELARHINQTLKQAARA
jgi:hypothetical protein